MPSSVELIAASIRAARKRKKITQKNLSKETKIPQSHISKIEKGGVDLQVSSLLEIARALDLEVMLVPRPLILHVLALQKPGVLESKEQVPLYQLTEEGL